MLKNWHAHCMNSGKVQINFTPFWPLSIGSSTSGWSLWEASVCTLWGCSPVQTQHSKVGSLASKAESGQSQQILKWVHLTCFGQGKTKCHCEITPESQSSLKSKENLNFRYPLRLCPRQHQSVHRIIKSLDEPWRKQELNELSWNHSLKKLYMHLFQIIYVPPPPKIFQEIILN